LDAGCFGTEGYIAHKQKFNFSFLHLSFDQSLIRYAKKKIKLCVMVVVGDEGV
jgi:hypothetical protein